MQEWLWAPYVHCKFLQPLTDRWREVPASVAHRMTNDDIAEEMVVSPATVRPASCDTAQRVTRGGEGNSRADRP
ncbi:MAG: hypothetical protein M3124_08590 [Actinomycetota bacterium]|nr:hypothetical protein [Actinomycetota bacterium]